MDVIEFDSFVRKFYQLVLLPILMHGLAFEYNLVKSLMVLSTIQFIIHLIEEDQLINAVKRGVKQPEM